MDSCTCNSLLPPANEVVGRLFFTGVCDSVHRGGGGIQHALQVSRLTPVGKLRCLSWGGLQAHIQGGIRGVWPGGISRPTSRGEVEGSGLGGSPGPHLGGLQAHTWGVSRPTPGGVSQHALRQIPPLQQMLLLRAVHILLECILVLFANASGGLIDIYLKTSKINLMQIWT